MRAVRLDAAVDGLLESTDLFDAFDRRDATDAEPMLSREEETLRRRLRDEERRLARPCALTDDLREFSRSFSSCLRNSLISPRAFPSRLRKPRLSSASCLSKACTRFERPACWAEP